MHTNIAHIHTPKGVTHIPYTHMHTHVHRHVHRNTYMFSTDNITESERENQRGGDLARMGGGGRQSKVDAYGGEITVVPVSEKERVELGHGEGDRASAVSAVDGGKKEVSVSWRQRAAAKDKG